METKRNSWDLFLSQLNKAQYIRLHEDVSEILGKGISSRKGKEENADSV